MADEVSTVSGDPRNPLPEMWAAGRAALYQAAREHPEQLCVALSLLGGVADMTARLLARADGHPPWGQLLLVLGVIGPAWGLARTYVIGAAVTVAGRALGGQGSYRATRAAFAWALLPLIAWLAVAMAFFAVLGRDIFLLRSHAARGEGLNLLLFGVLVTSLLAALAWHITVLARGLAAQHRFGIWRATASLLLGIVGLGTLVTLILLVV